MQPTAEELTTPEYSGFTNPAPPTYTEASMYDTVQDKAATPPPDYTVPSDNLGFTMYNIT